MPKLNRIQIDRVVKLALDEDLGKGDITTDLLIPPGLKGSAAMLVKEEGVSAGAEVAARVFQIVDRSLKVAVLLPDGSPVKPGDVILEVSGNVGSILKAERVALNFLQRLSGIASTTSRFVAAVKGLDVDIADTRKTTPGLRALEKYAVKMGGGRNHRFDLHEAVLIKDNHFAALRAAGLSYREVVARAVKGVRSGVKVEAEATSIEEAGEAAEAGADIVMLDNMAVDEMKGAAKLINHRAEVEASGGVTLETVRGIAESGVDFISVGALTHSYRALDISLEYESEFIRETG